MFGFLSRSPKFGALRLFGDGLLGGGRSFNCTFFSAEWAPKVKAKTKIANSVIDGFSGSGQPRRTPDVRS